MWDESTLRRQLSYQGFPRTLVAEQEGRVAGFVNYFPLRYLGRSEVLAGVIDFLCVEDLSAAERRRLVRAAMCQMADEGCHLCLFLRTTWHPYFLFLWTGFLSQPPEYQYIVQLMSPGAPRIQTRSVHAIWR